MYKVLANPAHVVIDRDGKIVFGQMGFSPKTKESLIASINSALNQKKTE